MQSSDVRNLKGRAAPGQPFLFFVPDIFHKPKKISRFVHCVKNVHKGLRKYPGAIPSGGDTKVKIHR